MIKSTTRALVLSLLGAVASSAPLQSNPYVRRNNITATPASTSNFTIASANTHRNLQTVTAWNQIGGDLNGEAAQDQNGFAVAISDDGSRIAVGAPQNDGGGVDAGKVRVYELGTNNVWNLIGTIQGSPAGAGSGAGQSLSISGDGLVVAVGSVRRQPYEGNVQVFRYENSAWRELLTLYGKEDADRFGSSVSLNYDGTKVAVGAPFHGRTATATGYGQTEVYDQDSDWQSIGTINGASAGDRSGMAVALSGDGTTVVVGEQNADPSTTLSDAGITKIYRRTSSLSGFAQLGADILGVSSGEQSGSSVAISEDGSIVAIASPMHSSRRSTGGMVRVFQYVSNTWQQLGSSIFPVTNQEGTKFGTSVSLSSSGLILAVGEPFESSEGYAGIYTYSTTTESWSEDTTLSAGSATDRFGFSVGLSGDGTRLIVGANEADIPGALDIGTARVYEFQTSDWILSVQDFQANFGTGTTPELVLTFSGIAPESATGTRTYRQEVLLSSCALGFATTTNADAIAPVAPNGAVPGGSSFTLTTQLDVNTDTIRGSGYFAEIGVGMGSLAFCVRTEILENLNDVKAERLADINLEIDMGQDFTVTNFISRDPTTGKTDIRDETKFNYAFTHYFCDNLGNAITSGGSSVPPGGEVSVCLEADANEPVDVVNVKTVSFENSLAPLLGEPLIDDEGNALQETTSKECDAGVCRIVATTVPKLYEYVDSSGNVNDVTAGVSMVGIVTFAFPSGRNLQEASGRLESTFRIQIDLAKPPDRTASRHESSGAASDDSFPRSLLMSMIAAALPLALLHLIG